MQAHSHNNTEAGKQPPQEAANNSIDARLERIEAGLTQINERANQEANKKKVDKRKASRSTVTLAFAFLGFKVFGLIGGKVGFVKGAVDAYKSHDPEHAKVTYRDTVHTVKGTDELIKKSFEFFIGFISNTTKIARETILWGTIAGGVGAILGGALGWARGDRIDDPYDLIKSPSESLKKIFGPAPKNHKPLDPAIEMPDAMAPRSEDIIKNEKDALVAPAGSNWQERMDKQSAERESALSAVNFM